MTRVVLDTNVLASGFLRSGHLAASPVRHLVNYWRRGRFDLLISDQILDELFDVFGEPYFIRRFSEGEVSSVLTLLRDEAAIVPVHGVVTGVAAHRHDDPILETAVAGQADYLVTGDHELLALRTYQGVQIVTAREFVAILDAEATTAAKQARR